MKTLKVSSISLVSAFLLSLAPSLTLAQGSEDDSNFYSKRYDSLDVDTIFRSSRLLNNYVECLLDRKPCPPEGKDLKRVLPHALRTKCARCTKIQKDKALDVITRVYYQHPSIYLALAERYDPKGEYTKNFENWFDEQQREKLNGQNEVPQRSRIPSTWITTTTTTQKSTTERSTSMRTLRTLPPVRTTTSGFIRIIPTTITERPSTIRTQPNTERITTPRSVPTTTTFLITSSTQTTQRPSTSRSTFIIRNNPILTTFRPTTTSTTSIPTQRPTTSRSTFIIRNDPVLTTFRPTTASTTPKPTTTTTPAPTSPLIQFFRNDPITSSIRPTFRFNSPSIRNDPFIPMKIPSNQMQFRPAMSSPFRTTSKPTMQPFPAQSFQPPMQTNLGFIPSNTQIPSSRFPPASIPQVQASVANQNPFSVPIPLPREPSVPASTFRTPFVQRPPQQRPIERPIGIDPSIIDIDNFFVPRNVQIQRSINQLLNRTNLMVNNMMRFFGG